MTMTSKEDGREAAVDDAPAVSHGPVRGWRRLLVEPPRPRWVARHSRAAWFVVATVCIGAFMGQLDASIVTMALPTLQHVFHADVAAVTWVGLSYLLVLVATVAAVGRFADMVGRKLLYTYGFAVFILGSVLCGLAPSLGALDGFRAFQAVGAAMLQANSVAIIYLAVPRKSRGRSIGIQGAAQALGLALGPAVGGLLLAAGGWRLVFFVNVPAGLVGMVAGLLFIPRSRHLVGRVPFDWTGLGLFFPAVVGLMVAVTFGNRFGWASPAIIGLLAAAVVLGVGFVVRERRTADPMIDLTLFHRSAFSAGVVSGLLSYLVMFGVLFVTPFYLERGLHLGAGKAGLELTIMPLFLGLAAPLAGRLADRVGARPLTVGGMALVAATLAALAVSRPGQAMLLVALALVGVGLGLFTPPNNAAIMASAPKHQSGVASGVLNMTRGMGTSLGLALTGLIYGLAATPRDGLRSAMIFLASASVAAAIVAASRGRSSAATSPRVVSAR
jgi:EmrB/QacA subfamily drug resistance transporter